MSGTDKKDENGFLTYCKLIAVEPSEPLIEMASELSKGDLKEFSNYFFTTYKNGDDGSKYLLQLQEIHRTVLYTLTMTFTSDHFNKDLSVIGGESNKEYLMDKIEIQKIRQEVNALSLILLKLDLLYAEFLEDQEKEETPLSTHQYGIFFKILFDKNWFPPIDNPEKLGLEINRITGKSYKQARKAFSRNSEFWTKKNLEKIKSMIDTYIDDEIENLLNQSNEKLR